MRIYLNKIQYFIPIFFSQSRIFDEVIKLIKIHSLFVHIQKINSFDSNKVIFNFSENLRGYIFRRMWFKEFFNNSLHIGLFFFWIPRFKLSFLRIRINLILWILIRNRGLYGCLKIHLNRSFWFNFFNKSEILFKYYQIIDFLRWFWFLLSKSFRFLIRIEIHNIKYLFLK